jgi:hypothetical protein
MSGQPHALSALYPQEDVLLLNATKQWQTGNCMQYENAGKPCQKERGGLFSYALSSYTKVSKGMMINE